MEEWSLRDIGAVEPCYLDPKTRTFVPGHPVAKSNNSAYRMDADFVEILKAAKWEQKLNQWAAEDFVRERKRFQADMADKTRARVDTKHQDLIDSTVESYAPRFLKGYQVVYVDATDGVRITEKDQKLLQEAGLELALDDAMPDVLLWNPVTNALWVIEAVTSDGEVDLHKQMRLTEYADRHGKAGIGFTTAYQTWKLAAQRQKSTHMNIAPGTYIWIEEAPSTHFHVETYSD